MRVPDEDRRAHEPLLAPDAPVNGPQTPVIAEADVTPASPPRKTRAARTWVALGGLALVLALLIVFIAQNGHKAKISFLGWSGHFPLGLALLVAAVGGIVITLLAGSARIIQLRREVRRQRKAPPVAER